MKKISVIGIMLITITLHTCFIYVSYIAWLSQEIILVHNCNKIFIALHVLSELLVREKNVPVLLIFGKSLR